MIKEQKNERKLEDSMITPRSSNLSNVGLEITPQSNEKVEYTNQTSIKGILKKRFQMGQNVEKNEIQHKMNMSDDDKYEPSVISKDSSSRIKSDLISMIIHPSQSQKQLTAKDLIVYQEKKQQYFEQEIIVPFQINSKNPEKEQILDQNISMIQSKKNDVHLNEFWKHGALRIIYYITKFARQIKTKASKIKFKLLTKSILSFIDDQGSDIKEVLLMRKLNDLERLDKMRKIKTNDNFIQFFYVIQQFISKSIPIIEPESTFKIIWDFLVVFLIVVNIFYIPMKLSFDFDTKNQDTAQLLLETIPSWVFVFDILLNFNTAYYSKGYQQYQYNLLIGVIHRDKKEVIQFYLKGNFCWDLVVVIPFILAQFDIQHTQYTLLLRVTKVRSMMENLEDVLNLEDNVQVVLELLKSVYFIIFVAHFCACAWHYLGWIQVTVYNQDQCWLLHYGIYNEPWQTRYVHSFYFSTITTLTIGYGDLVPQTTAEKIFVIVVALIICGVFGYTISSIGNIFKQLQEKKYIYKTKMKFINQFLKKKRLNKQLQLQVRKYFEYFFKVETDRNQQAEELMTLLSKNLKEQVCIDLYYKILTKSRIIRENLQKNSIQKLCNYAKEKSFVPEETVFVQGDVSNRLMYIQKGSISFYANCQNQQDKTLIKETLLRTYNQGVFISEREFATNSTYDYSAKATKFTQVVYISSEDFFKVLKDNETEMHKFCMVRDNLIFNENFRNFGQVCEICSWTHKFNNCPFVFVQVNTNKIANQLRISEDQQRSYVKREGFIRSQALAIIQDIQECVLAVILNNNYLTEMELTDNYLINLGFILENDIMQQDSKAIAIQDKNVVPRGSIQRVTNSSATQNNSNPEPDNDFFKSFEKKISRNDSFDIKPSDLEKLSPDVLNPNKVDRNTYLNSKFNSIDDNSSVHPIPNSPQQQLKRVKFTSHERFDVESIKPFPSKGQLQKRKITKDSSIVSIQAMALDTQKSITRIDSLRSRNGSEYQAQRNTNFLRNNRRERSFLRKTLVGGERLQMPRQALRRTTSNSIKSQRNDLTPLAKSPLLEQELSETSNEYENDNEFQIVFQQITVQIDKFLNSKSYFPNYNMNVVIQKVQDHQEQLMKKREQIKKLQNLSRNSRSIIPWNKRKSGITPVRGAKSPTDKELKKDELDQIKEIKEIQE